MRALVLCAMTAGTLAFALAARAIDAKTALDKLGFPSDTQQQVLDGQRLSSNRA
jgi:hypothetical protein